MKKILLLLLGFSLFFGSCSAGDEPATSGGKDEVQSLVRGVWIPDPSHTDCMKTYQKVLNTVSLLKELQINTVFLCAWARTQTIYKSPVLIENSAYNTVEEGFLFKDYIASYNVPDPSPTNDPVRDLIHEAHKAGIRVIFWFEYGFMASHGTTPASNPLLSKNPDWMSKNNEGTQANYKGTDYYFNAYNPEVQDFLFALIEESMTLYPEIDGIQGDDRMPAMPRNSGYDDYTVNRYKAEHNNSTPPSDFNHSEWVRWRLNILNEFGVNLYKKVKAKNENALLCFSPNPYPWCEQNLMQEWPKWIESGIVDILSVQCYRNNIDVYKSTLNETGSHCKAKTSKQILNPGIILKNGSTIMSPDLLRKQLDANKDLRTNGETFFFIDGLYDTEVQKVLKEFYSK